jgi:phosphatidylglycerophosphate synthase
MQVKFDDKQEPALGQACRRAWPGSFRPSKMREATMQRSTAPLLLTALRAALAPVLVWLAHWQPSPVGFGVCLILALLSDIFDGVLARHLGVATPMLRRLDSVADSIFYLAALFAVWHLRPNVIMDRLPLLCILAALELARYLLDYIKFRREASYHMWSSKLWGLALFVAFFSILVLGRGDTLAGVAIWIGIVADLEGIIISILLPRWQTDVPTFVHAIHLRRMHAA